MENYASTRLENGVNQLAKLPGIGKRTALRLALWLLKQDEQVCLDFGQGLMDMRQNIVYCKRCHNISDHEECEICSGLKRDKTLVCVVSDVRDVMAIENTGLYQGLYHVLGGVISPIEGISPRDLNIESLIERLKTEDFKEIILALPSTMEGDTTQFYIQKQAQDYPVKISTIARGIAVGDDLEYTDELTLGRSLQNRIILSE